MQINFPKELNSHLKKEYGFEKDVIWLDSLKGLSSLNHEIQVGDKNFVLKRYRSTAEEDIERIEKISFFLHSHHFPVFPPIPSSQGQFHFSLNGRIFALYPKTKGQVLHQITLSDPALQAVGRLLAQLHQLNPPSIIGLKHLNQRLLSKESIEQNAKQTLSLIAKRSLNSRIDQLTKELIYTKLDFLKQFPWADLFYAYKHANHLVHGDFHNENLLFDSSRQNIVRLLDFEETHLGHRVEDVVHFILLACCNSGYEKNNLKKAQAFLQAYSADFPLTQEELSFGVHLELFKEFSSFFLEHSLFETQDLFFAQLIERDRKKIDYFSSNLSAFLKDLSI